MSPRSSTSSGSLTPAMRAARETEEMRGSGHVDVDAERSVKGKGSKTCADM